MRKYLLKMVVILGFSLFAGCGSQSSDIPSAGSAENPLPPCPDSPNCIRITKEIDNTVDATFSVALRVLQDMEPATLNKSQKEWKLEAVFKVFLFRDDMVVQVNEKDSTSSYLHIRSASRVGESDLGVNTRRVKKFLKKLQSKL